MLARWWLARVTFERTDDCEDILPSIYEGAAGWMACEAAGQDDVRAILARELAAVGLRLLSIDEEAPITSPEDLSDKDEHLAQNFGERRADAVSVWGTLFPYTGSGEA